MEDELEREPVSLDKVEGFKCFLGMVAGEQIEDYWKNGGGGIQFISDCGGNDLLKTLKKSTARPWCAVVLADDNISSRRAIVSTDRKTNQLRKGE